MSTRANQTNGARKRPTTNVSMNLSMASFVRYLVLRGCVDVHGTTRGSSEVGMVVIKRAPEHSVFPNLSGVPTGLNLYPQRGLPVGRCLKVGVLRYARHDLGEGAARLRVRLRYDGARPHDRKHPRHDHKHRRSPQHPYAPIRSAILNQALISPAYRLAYTNPALPILASRPPYAIGPGGSGVGAWRSPGSPRAGRILIYGPPCGDVHE